MFKPQMKGRHVNPRFRAYGKARIDIAKRVRNQDDWHDLWKNPTNAFPFQWGENWKQCVEYNVDDFAAEVGFYTDILGLPVNAFDPDYAMFTSPNKEFYFSIVPTPEGEYSTPLEAFRIQFMVKDLLDTVEELQRRGIVFEQLPQPCQEGSSLYIGYFRTPHGICIDLWGSIDPREVSEDKLSQSQTGASEVVENHQKLDLEEDGIDKNHQGMAGGIHNNQKNLFKEDLSLSDKDVENSVEIEYVDEDEALSEKNEYFDKDDQENPWKVRYS